MDPRLTNIILLTVLSLIAIILIAQMLLSRRKDGALRKEMAKTFSDVRELREEVQSKFASLLGSMIPASTVTRSIDDRLEKVRESLEQRLREMQEESAAMLDHAGESTLAVATGQRQESADALEKVKETLVTTLDRVTLYLNQMVSASLSENTTNQRSQLSAIVEHLTKLVQATEQKLEMHRRESDARMEGIAAEVAVVAKFQAATRAFGATLAGEFDSADADHFPSR